jgi:hypothetical protein
MLVREGMVWEISFGRGFPNLHMQENKAKHYNDIFILPKSIHQILIKEVPTWK